MAFTLSPKIRRNLSRILPFPIIWLLIGWTFMLVEFAATGSIDPISDAAIKPNQAVMVFAAAAIAGVGLLIGLIELVYLENLFRNRSFFAKILYKLLLYSLLLICIVAVLFPIAASLELKVPIWSEQVWQKFFHFLGSLVFFSTLLQMGCSLLLSLIYAAISEHLGYTVVFNFFTGRYHHPRDELRIFIFLDMKSSTRIAEQLGHHRYFLLLRDFYDDLGPAIIKHGGEVYQYIGDEIVISWKYNLGIDKNNCLDCFFTMKKDLEHSTTKYQQTYGVVPKFKAGLHYGQVTVGEIGALKKDIAFSGDVLNTTARIQSLCNQYQAELLASGSIMDHLSVGPEYQVRELGAINLKGREAALELIAITRNSI